MRIGELSELTGLSISAIRYYEDEGLLPIIPRNGGKRNFSLDTTRLLQFIKIAQESGFKISEIRDLVSGLNQQGNSLKSWRELAESKIVEMDALIDRANAMKGILERGLGCECLRLEDCEILESFKKKQDGDRMTKAHVAIHPQ